MAIASIAYTAAAGAMALAVSTTYLAWRTRSRLAKARDTLKADLFVKDTMLSELDAATSAFDEAFLAVEGDAVRLVWGEETLKACAEALGVKASNEADQAPLVVEALGKTSPEAAKGLKALIAEGRSCRIEIFADAAPGLIPARPAGLTLVLEGKSSGATAWIRLAIAGAKASLSSGPFAQMAEHLPAPCWICARDGRMVWANEAWLKAAETPNLEQALKDAVTLDRSADTLVSEATESRSRREGFRWLTVGGQRRGDQRAEVRS